jgi:hypothetical protein
MGFRSVLAKFLPRQYCGHSEPKKWRITDRRVPGRVKSRTATAFARVSVLIDLHYAYFFSFCFMFTDLLVSILILN